MRNTRMPALCAAGLILASPAYAAGADLRAMTETVSDQALPPALTALIARPDHRLALLRAAEAVVVPSAACRDAAYSTTGEVGLLTPLRFSKTGAVIAGAWKEQVRESGCGPDRLLNAMTTIAANGALQTQPLLPGTTITDPQLQRDSIEYAAQAIGTMPAGCDEGAVIDTRFIGVDGQDPGIVPQPGRPPKPWTETWTLQACTRKIAVTMHFRPDTNGTEILAEPATAS